MIMKSLHANSVFPVLDLQIKEKLVSLTNQRNVMLHRWEERWEHLQLSQYLYSFFPLPLLFFLIRRKSAVATSFMFSCPIAVLEVYQFARDAAVAEAWLIAQEPYLLSHELGVSMGMPFFNLYLCILSILSMFSWFLWQHTIDEVENLIKRHEAFEKSAAAQEERFAALERLTTVSPCYIFPFQPT